MLTKLRTLITRLLAALPGGTPPDPEAELQYTADRHLLLLDAKRVRLRAYVAGEVARAEAGDDLAPAAAPSAGKGRFRRGK